MLVENALAASSAEEYAGEVGVLPCFEQPLSNSDTAVTTVPIINAPIKECPDGSE